MNFNINLKSGENNSHSGREVSPNRRSESKKKSGFDQLFCYLSPSTCSDYKVV